MEAIKKKAGPNNVLNGPEMEVRAGLTERAVLILGSIDGSIWLHLELEALTAGQPGHYAL